VFTSEAGLKDKDQKHAQYTIKLKYAYFMIDYHVTKNANKKA